MTDYIQSSGYYSVFLYTSFSEQEQEDMRYCTTAEKLKRDMFEIIKAGYEAGFSPDCQSIMDFETFCKELDLGYGNSNCIQVARLYEAPDGKIWYDTEYYGQECVK